MKFQSNLLSCSIFSILIYHIAKENTVPDFKRGNSQWSYSMCYIETWIENFVKNELFAVFSFSNSRFIKKKKWIVRILLFIYNWKLLIIQTNLLYYRKATKNHIEKKKNKFYFIDERIELILCLFFNRRSTILFRISIKVGLTSI